MEREKGLSGQIEEFARNYRQEIMDSARSLPEEMPEITEELFALFEQCGNRLKFEAVYFTRRRFLAVLGLQALLETGEKGRAEEACLSRLTKVMEEICGERCWALPAHVDRGKEGWEITVDLFACETAQTLAELADRLRGQLPEALYERISDEIEKRILKPYFTSAVPYGNWECGNTNWNAVCAGSIGSVCLHLMRKEPRRLEDCLKRVCRSLSFYPDGFSEDGACLEGIGYFTYGMTFFTNFAQELYEYSEGRENLFCRVEGRSWEEKISRMVQFPAKCFFPDGKAVNFSDADRNETFRVGLSCVLRRHFREMRFPNMSRAAGLHSDSCYRFAALKMDLLDAGTEPTEEKAGADRAREERFCILSDAQWCIGNAFRQGRAIGFACKGGNNGEPHNQNDVGHFIYEAEGVTLFTDLGCGEYTQEYFSEGRYGILCNRSLGHSVPLMAGQEQCTGEAAACGSFRASEDGKVEMELSAAYPEKAVKSFARSFRFDTETGDLELCDDIVPGEAGATNAVGREERSVNEAGRENDGRNTVGREEHSANEAGREDDGRNAVGREERSVNETGREDDSRNAVGWEERSINEAGREAGRDAAGAESYGEAVPMPEVVENLVTQIRPVILTDGVLLEAEGIRCRLCIEAPEKPDIRVEMQVHVNHRGGPEDVYLIQWRVPAAGGHAVSRCSIKLLS